MDNKAIAHIFYETADLMEVNGDDSFRIRSYRNAAEALEGYPAPVSGLLDEPKKLLAVIKIVGGSGVLVLIGAWIYVAGRRRAARALGVAGST